MQNNQRYDAVLFDLDGVLFHTEIAYTDIMAQLMRQLGYPVSRAALLATIGESMACTWQILVEDSGCPLSPAQLDAALADWAGGRTLPFDQLADDDAAMVLQALSRRGLRLGVVSSSSRALIAEALQQSGLAKYIVQFISADDVAMSKPDPEGYLQMAQLLGVAPQRCLAVEDTRVGLLAAQSAGMAVAGRKRVDYQQDLSQAQYHITALPQLLPIVEGSQPL